MNKYKEEFARPDNGRRTIADALKVSEAMGRMKYNWYKGDQFYRKCDHQSVQSVIIVQSKSTGMKDKNDVVKVAAIEAPNEANRRACTEAGHKD